MKSVRASTSNPKQPKKNLVIILGISPLLYPVLWKWVASSYFSYYAKYFTVHVVTLHNLPQNKSLQSIVTQYAKRLHDLQPYALFAIEEGATIAQYIAAQNPNLLEKLVITSTMTSLNPQSQQIFDEWIKYAQQDCWTRLNQSMSHHFRNKYSLPYSLAKKPHNLKQLAFLLQNLQQHNSEKMVRNIKCETLVIGGENDSLISSQQFEHLASLIPQAQYLSVSEGCHHVYHQKKSIIDPNILHFLLR